MIGHFKENLKYPSIKRPVRGIPLKINSSVLKIWRGKDGYFDDEDKRFKKIIEEDILTKYISKDGRMKQIQWARSAIEKRIDAIVSNKYRGSYDKAALLLVGCVESLNLIGKSTESQTFFNKIKARYNRHSAFQQEIRQLLSK